MTAGCDCDGEPVPGAWVGMNDRDEVQRCDDCERFACDEDAADAVAARVGGVRVDMSDPPDAFWTVVVRDGRTVTADDVRAAR